MPAAGAPAPHATRTVDIFPEIGQLALSGRPVTIVVPDVDRAGPVRGTGEPARVVRDALKPLAAVESVRLLADVPREFAVELAEGLPPGVAQIIDLDAPEWADHEGLVRQAEALLDPRFGAPELPFTTEPDARRALAEDDGLPVHLLTPLASAVAELRRLVARLSD
ncbi:hypothetical protein ACGF4C_31180 [Streptomyces sp. NPDC048197]|uniref:hypothetical protein n=1 Tax=Streptomyces sp. NPDC048197 TaxID=3365511 RepID=UPI003722C976